MLKRFPERQRNEVMVRIATLDGIQPSALKDLNEVMGKVLAGGDRVRKAPLGGVKAAAEIINLLGSAHRDRGARLHPRGRQRPGAEDHGQHVHLRRPDASVDDKGIQALLKEVQSESLVIALKGATPELRDKIFKNMSTRAAETLREELESRGPVRVVRGRGRAEGNAQDRAPPGRRRPDRDRRRRRR